LSPIALILRILTGKGIPKLPEWFRVRFDASTVYMHADPPGKAAWSQSFPWDSIERIMFRAEGFESSDGIYVFTRLRPESFVVPMEAKGGSDLWDEILRRGLFDPELAIQAASSSGGDFWWPPKSAT